MLPTPMTPSATDDRLECVLGNEQLAAHHPEGEAVVSRPQDREFTLGSSATCGTSEAGAQRLTATGTLPDRPE
jgi:hypothetical protein